MQSAAPSVLSGMEGGASVAIRTREWDMWVDVSIQKIVRQKREREKRKEKRPTSKDQDSLWMWERYIWWDWPGNVMAKDGNRKARAEDFWTHEWKEKSRQHFSPDRGPALGLVYRIFGLQGLQIALPRCVFKGCQVLPKRACHWSHSSGESCKQIIFVRSDIWQCE